MKSIYIFAFALLTISLNAQIPNADFEAWTSNSWNYTPDGWMTENSQLQEPVTQELNSYEGDYAMRITAVNMGLGEYGSATATFPIDHIPASLDFYYKTQIMFGGVGAIISFKNMGEQVAQYEWSSSEQVTDWTLLSIPMDQIKPVIDEVEIHIYAQVGDLLDGVASIAVDAIGFDGTSSLADISNFNISAFPNPANDVLTILDSDQQLERVTIFDITGKQVKQVSLNMTSNQINVSDLNMGIYSMIATHRDGQKSTHKLLIVR